MFSGVFRAENNQLNKNIQQKNVKSLNFQHYWSKSPVVHKARYIMFQGFIWHLTILSVDVDDLEMKFKVEENNR